MCNVRIIYPKWVLRIPKRWILCPAKSARSLRGICTKGIVALPSKRSHAPMMRHGRTFLKSGARPEARRRTARRSWTIALKTPAAIPSVGSAGRRPPTAGSRLASCTRRLRPALSSAGRGRAAGRPREPVRGRGQRTPTPRRSRQSGTAFGSACYRPDHVHSEHALAKLAQVAVALAPLPPVAHGRDRGHPEDHEPRGEQE